MSATNNALSEPLSIANGRIILQNCVVMAPMIRNRGVPLSDGTPESPNRVWLPDEHVALYYAQRASPGGLLITEGIPPSLEASGMPGVPGIFHEAQVDGWRKVVDDVHAKGGFIYAQLWHAGRAAIPQMTGSPTLSASSTPWDDDETYPFRVPFTKEKVAYRDHPPRGMSQVDIDRTIGDFVRAAKAAIDAGFDGVEINGGDGNLLDQFLHSNINNRPDGYGGSPENRTKFPLEVVGAVAGAIGPSNVAIRLEPTGSYNHARGAERVETWSYLCSQLGQIYAGKDRLSYVHFIEPRFDRINKEAERASTACFSCGGWDGDNFGRALEQGWDAVVFAKWFTSNPDLPARLLRGLPLQAYDRSRFYGSWDGVRERGYTDYPTYEQEGEK
ncbi:NADH:flavin oxidoreductase NADH oxidase [Colletotrichum musicola]|uniref:NADH:flavin oxidoreductase NADH oxidase n=1 Tax=Colletotrichum musicola TaxID=2175873 RepID=A0A8H6K4V6_9PEZI|nr:NADH:flavin oxidoreductase NADH oxidase [Colletotrichum musicola]